MLGDLEQVYDALEPRLTSQFRSDVNEADQKDGINLDLAILHPIALPDCDVRVLPDADAARDLTPSHTVAQSLREDHVRTLL